MDIDLCSICRIFNEQCGIVQNKFNHTRVHFNSPVLSSFIVHTITPRNLQRSIREEEHPHLGTSLLVDKFVVRYVCLLAFQISGASYPEFQSYKVVALYLPELYLHDVNENEVQVYLTCRIFPSSEHQQKTGGVGKSCFMKGGMGN